MLGKPSSVEIQASTSKDANYSPVLRVRSYLDAQNTFGAVVRTRFQCTALWQAKTGEWRAISITTSAWSTPP